MIEDINRRDDSNSDSSTDRVIGTGTDDQSGTESMTSKHIDAGENANGGVDVPISKTDDQSSDTDRQREEATAE